MLAPYDVLLGQYKNHPIIGTYLDGNIPNFGFLIQLLDMMETEPRIMVKVAFALYQGETSASIQELLELSDVQFDRVIEALRIHRISR